MSVTLVERLEHCPGTRSKYRTIMGFCHVGDMHNYWGRLSLLSLSAFSFFIIKHVEFIFKKKKKNVIMPVKCDKSNVSRL